eukprot:scaffold49609_cov45-Phaeocystis_antarctica.AAC.2
MTRASASQTQVDLRLTRSDSSRTKSPTLPRCCRCKFASCTVAGLQQGPLAGRQDGEPSDTADTLNKYTAGSTGCTVSGVSTTCAENNAHKCLPENSMAN